MEQYVSRRRRSWTPLTQMDPVIHPSERHRSDMSLDLSGLTRKGVSKSTPQLTMKVTSTKSQMLSSFNIHVFIFGKVGSARKKKAKIHIGFEKEVNTATTENLERVLATQTPTSSRTTTTVTTRLNERILIEHTVTRLTLEVTAEKKFQAALCTRKTTHVFSICCSERRLYLRGGQARSICSSCRQAGQRS